MNVAEKHIAVLGLARSGESVARLLHSKGAKITIFDSGNSEALQSRARELRTLGIKIETGDADSVGEAFDLVVVSPGIDPASSFVRQFSDRGIPLTGELEVAWQYCHKPVVAITGTNGKTTTTELISTMLNGAGVKTVACGNIGLPFSDVVADAQDALDIITVEVSSFQLETIETFRPHFALWLNFSPDHLDRYSSVSDYREAKLRIFDHQKDTDFAIVNATENLPDLNAKKVTFSAYQTTADFTIVDQSIAYGGQPIARLDSFQASGLHNAENVMAALATGRALNIPFDILLPPLQAYRPAPHRCETVAWIDDVCYVNDSKATNVDALEKALISNQKPVILIAGGKDKGFAYSSLRNLIADKVSQAFLIGEMADKIREDWNDIVPCRTVSTLVQAVSEAHLLAKAGDTVLFSPGTSSFDMFRDYADRGEQFRNAVRNLQTQPI